MRVFLPETLGELWEGWEKTPDALIYSGGTDLMVRLRDGVIHPSTLICLERITALQNIHEQEDAVIIGAGASHAALMQHPLVLAYAPVLAEGLRVLGSPLIRNMGTLGGNIATASPAGDSLPALYVLDTEVILASAQGTRTLPIRDFITGPGQTVLNPQEIISGLRVRKTGSYTVSRYEKAGKRKAMAIAVASLAACLRLSPEGIIETIHLAWGSVGPTIVTVLEIEEALKGQPLTPELLEGMAPMVKEAISPIDDIRASAAYRERIAVNLFIRLSEITATHERGSS